MIALKASGEVGSTAEQGSGAIWVLPTCYRPPLVIKGLNIVFRRKWPAF